MGAQVSVGEPVRLQSEGEQRGEQGLGTWVTEAQRDGVLAVDVDGLLTVLNAAAPVIGSWLMRWTPSRRRLAVKPSCRSAGRLVSRFESPKSRVSLIVVSVRKARPSLWYCLIVVCL